MLRLRVRRTWQRGWLSSSLMSLRFLGGFLSSLLALRLGWDDAPAKVVVFQRPYAGLAAFTLRRPSAQASQLDRQAGFVWRSVLSSSKLLTRPAVPGCRYARTSLCGACRTSRYCASEAFSVRGRGLPYRSLEQEEPTIPQFSGWYPGFPASFAWHAITRHATAAKSMAYRHRFALPMFNLLSLRCVPLRPQSIA